MDYVANINFKIEINPGDLRNCNVSEFIKQKYINNIYLDYIILNVEEILSISGGKILNSGNVSYSILASCTIRNPQLDSTYSIHITQLNTMGAMCRFDKLNIFIPRQYFGDHDVLENTLWPVKIIGKRVEDTIVCIGTLVQ